MVSFKEENTVAFKHLFLKGYSGTDEDDYSCSIYTQQDAYDSIFYVINQVGVSFNLRICIDTYNFEVSVCFLMQKRLIPLTSSSVFFFLN